MAERRIPYLVVWLLFLLSVIAGASLLLSSDGRLQALGVVLFFLPIIALGAIMALYYWRSRRMADGSP